MKRTFVRKCEAVDCQFNFDNECSYKEIIIDKNFECKKFASVMES